MAKKLSSNIVKTKVVHCKKSLYDVYIGRGSIWGNPFSHKQGTRAKYIVESRDEAIREYAKWIMNQPQLLSKLYTLKGKVLGCWCKPKRCHGDILAQLADKV
jgi:hypothetical protein